MITTTAPPPALAVEELTLYYTTDLLLSGSPILIFYGPSTTTTSLAAASRIQVHLYSVAGFQSFPRLSISPSSQHYSAVNHLAREDQGDETCRGMAFALHKYFTELPDSVKSTWAQYSLKGKKAEPRGTLFDDKHAGELASRMVKVENIGQVVADIQQALAEQYLSWIDMDILLPPGSVRPATKNQDDYEDAELNQEDELAERYGAYAPLVGLFGEWSFLPTSRIRRAPSKPTGVNRSALFSRQQKETLRREMCELLDTEERYVSKLYDLVHSVAEDFRQKARSKSMLSLSPTEDALRGLFPPSLDGILNVNSGFLEAIRQVLDETEDEAIRDIESTQGVVSQFRPGTASKDVTGAHDFANCMLDWVPKFADCYSDYIIAHAQFGQYLKVFMKETGSSFSKRVQETGEQRLTSMLIEPVQRLPRYNLYIDNILKQLPSRHPAIKPLVKVRDTIADICSRDSPLTQQGKIIERLQQLIPSWPHDAVPRGRLLTAIDVFELAPPYHQDSPGSTTGILVLFAGTLVLLKKTSKSSMSARGLLAEIDRSNAADGEPSIEDLGTQSLFFIQDMDLAAVSLSELGNGRMIQLTMVKTSSESASESSRLQVGDRTSKVFQLTGSYEGKATRLAEEWAKAQVEARFTEKTRESNLWECRSRQPQIGSLGMFTAILPEEGALLEGYERDAARVTIIVDPAKGGRDVRRTTSGWVPTVTLIPLSEDFYRLEIDGAEEYSTRDNLSGADLIPVLSKRLSAFHLTINQTRNPLQTVYLFNRNQKILQSINLKLDSAGEEEQQHRQQQQQQQEQPTEKHQRAPSPVKMLASMFGSSVMGGQSSPKKNPLGIIPSMPPPSTSRPSSSDSTQRSFGDFAMQLPPKYLPEPRGNSVLTRLEDTLAAYVLALHARKGNVVGRVLLNRAGADELSVNELYNSLLEYPEDHQLAAQCSVDVLFAAFEKFLNMPWKDRIGPIVSNSDLATLQSRSSNVHYGDFEDCFRSVFDDMAPQNQRALKAVIRLLADLLEGTGNDGDRGLLTATFAEVLVEGNAHDFMSILDRLVEDIDSLFPDTAPSGQASPVSGSGSMSGSMRHKHTGSMSSNASSLRKRFGFGLSRENSKTEESKIGSVWRTLSKTKSGNESQPASLSKPSLVRTRSTDLDNRFTLQKRPGSSDQSSRPTILGSSSFEDPQAGNRPTSFVYGAPLGTIGEAAPQQTNGPPRKKRRSSLSDLKALQSTNADLSWTELTPGKKNPPTPQRGLPRPTSSSQQMPTPTRSATGSGTSTAQSSIRLPSPAHKENRPALPRNWSPVHERSPTTKTDEVKVTTVTHPSPAPVKRRTDSLSGIPLPKAASALSERPTSGNVTKLPPPPLNSVAPKKLRVQSPQKLRERALREQQAAKKAEASLQSELRKIGDEIGSLGLTPTRTVRANTATGTVAPLRLGADKSLATLSSRVQALETQVTTVLTELNTRNANLQRDLTSTLSVSEAKAKKLDELYRDANAENEALYSRFNDELGRVLGKVKAGEGVEELRRELKRAQEELVGVRRENMRLKRENVGLRAQLRE